VQTFLLATQSRCGQNSLVNKYLCKDIIKKISQYLKFPVRYLPEKVCYDGSIVEFLLGEFAVVIIPHNYYCLKIQLNYKLNHILTFKIQEKNNHILLVLENSRMHYEFTWNKNDTDLPYKIFNFCKKQSLILIPSSNIISIEILTCIQQHILNSINICLNKMCLKHQRHITQERINRLTKRIAYQCLSTYDDVC